MCSSYLGLFGAMGAMAVGQAYTAELFPTSIRLKATGIIYTGAMAGAFIVPFWMIIDAKISWITTCINFAGICFCGEFLFLIIVISFATFCFLHFQALKDKFKGQVL